ncbi:Uncharacterised protein [BD1-7 clade bacterium]|uniref:Elp3/MiaA/NifB-like radical SAM core domain-containing protein n=1 Tax=BD1-7 clade bacterium TaxID=2029982 RepID=A0A5S9P4F6_9GAMM|nr:Uncharacterised protein [BD1-7 clade bacterium]CAA0098232.1 Uncharacterised protein [BD1-7 clade bacterium]
MSVCLVNMPYASMARPSIALGLIKTYLSKAGLACQVIDANLLYAKKAGVKYTYLVEAINHEHMAGEWTFAPAAFPEMQGKDPAYFELFPNIHKNLKTLLQQHRAYTPRFIRELADDVIATNPKIVGCTSTFQQNCASLALLREIKQKRPDIITMMGGANCEGIMGQTLINAFDWLDFVFSGECDETIVPLIQTLLTNETPIESQFEGLLTRQTQTIASDTAITRAAVEDMSHVGMPNYDDYFATLEQLALSDEINPGLVLETSRGCWWGAKAHCTFCGLNGMGMDYRAKPANTVLDEMDTLFFRHKINRFEVVDNIMAAEYIKTLTPHLSGDERHYEIFYETKANLKEHQVKAMADAGIRWIQPGLESLNDDFLKLVRKGTTAIQNVATLKWCTQFGVRLFWNLLSNIPGEKDSWYSDMADWLPMIAHLQAPRQNLIKVRYPRFSPYFDAPERWGISIKPLASYRHIYPLDDEQLTNIAYFFESTSEEPQANYKLETSYEFSQPGHTKLEKALKLWIQQYWGKQETPQLTMTFVDNDILIEDTREIATQPQHCLRGIDAEIYLACHTPIHHDALMRKFADNANMNNNFETALQTLQNNKLLLKNNQRYLALALNGKAAELPKLENFPGGYIKTAETLNSLNG